MLYLKFRYRVAGGHAYFLMFCNRNGWSYTFQKCGEFVMDAKDVSDFKKLFDTLAFLMEKSSESSQLSF